MRLPAELVEVAFPRRGERGAGGGDFAADPPEFPLSGRSEGTVQKTFLFPCSGSVSVINGRAHPLRHVGEIEITVRFPAQLTGGSLHGDHRIDRRRGRRGRRGLSGFARTGRLPEKPDASSDRQTPVLTPADPQHRQEREILRIPHQPEKRAFLRILVSAGRINDHRISEAARRTARNGRNRRIVGEFRVDPVKTETRRGCFDRDAPVPIGIRLDRTALGVQFAVELIGDPQGKFQRLPELTSGESQRDALPREIDAVTRIAAGAQRDATRRQTERSDGQNQDCGFHQRTLLSTRKRAIAIFAASAVHNQLPHKATGPPA